MAYQPGALAAGLLALLVWHPALAEEPAPANTAFLSLATSDAASSDWSGFFFGAALATPHGKNTWQVHDLALELVPSRWTGSAMIVSIGHDWQRGRLTYGGIVSLGTGQIAAAPTSGVFFTCIACETTIQDLMTVRGRVGLSAGETHVFASGGLARANVAATNVGGAMLINDDKLSGWTLGLGVERRIGDGLSLALSYDHFDLGALDLSSYVPQTDSDISFDLMQVGMNFRW